MSSFSTVLVIGGTGFIGSHVVKNLAATGRRIIVPTRNMAQARHLAPFKSVELIEADVHEPAVLNRLMQGVGAVINLVGILHSRRGRPYGPDFAKAHVELPKKIVSACRENGVTRLLHMSALGASKDGPSMYQRSKADGETVVLADPALATTIFRPSVVFGREDRFLNMFASLQKKLPVMLLAGAKTRFQPVYVGDVAQAFVNALDNEKTFGKIYELAGPKIYTLRQLLELSGRYSGHPRPIIELPESLARLQAMLFELAPGTPLISRDNVDSMKVDNIASAPVSPELGLTLTELEAVAPEYLSKIGKPK